MTRLIYCAIVRVSCLFGTKLYLKNDFNFSLECNLLIVTAVVTLMQFSSQILFYTVGRSIY